jgi:hypothetical protein
MGSGGNCKMLIVDDEDTRLRLKRVFHSLIHGMRSLFGCLYRRLG